MSACVGAGKDHEIAPVTWREHMRFPDLDANDFTSADHRMWLMVLLGALGEQSDQIVSLLPDEAAEAVLVYLVSMLNAEEAHFGAPWRRVLRLD